MKISDNLKSSYWFNFLAVCGWICLFIFLALISISLIYGFAGILISKIIAEFFALFLLILFIFSFFIYLIEIILCLKIKNKTFLQNKYLIYFQSVGIILLLIIFLFLIILFGSDVIQFLNTYKYNFI